MDRAEAINLYKEIGSACNIDIAFVSLVPPTKEDVLSKGYQLHIKSFLNTSDRECIQKIVDNHHLDWTELYQTIVIYKPQKKQART